MCVCYRDKRVVGPAIGLNEKIYPKVTLTTVSLAYSLETDAHQHTILSILTKTLFTAHIVVGKKTSKQTKTSAALEQAYVLLFCD